MATVKPLRFPIALAALVSVAPVATVPVKVADQRVAGLGAEDGRGAQVPGRGERARGVHPAMATVEFDSEAGRANENSSEICSKFWLLGKV